MRKILAWLHRYLGITAGTLLALNGLTGAILAFEPQWLERFGPEAQQVTPSNGGEKLSPGRLLERVIEQNPGRYATTMIVSSSPTAPVKVRLAVQPPSLPGAGPGGPGGGPPGARPASGPGALSAAGPPPGPAPADAPPPGGPPGARPPGPGRPPLVAPKAFVLVDPYTGDLLPETTLVSRFFDGLEEVHRGMWLGVGPLGTALRVTLAYCVLTLFYMVLAGLYLRWPKARRLDWRTWFKIHFRLKGFAFNYSLHTVIGTFVVVIYLMTAHTGLMIGRQVGWYYQGAVSVRESLGLAGLPRDPFRTANSKPESVDAVWRSFERQQQSFKAARVEFPVDPVDAIVIRSGAQALSFASNNGALLDARAIPDEDDEFFNPEIAGGEANVNEPFFKALLNGNPLMHTGRRWGIAGQFIMMCAGLCMPIMFVSGWLMYLKRRKRKKRA